MDFNTIFIIALGAFVYFVWKSLKDTKKENLDREIANIRQRMVSIAWHEKNDELKSNIDYMPDWQIQSYITKYKEVTGSTLIFTNEELIAAAILETLRYPRTAEDPFRDYLEKDIAEVRKQYAITQQRISEIKEKLHSLSKNQVDFNELKYKTDRIGFFEFEKYINQSIKKIGLYDKDVTANAIFHEIKGWSFEKYLNNYVSSSTNNLDQS